MKNMYFITENRKLYSRLRAYYFGELSFSSACFQSPFFFSFFIKKHKKKKKKKKKKRKKVSHQLNSSKTPLQAGTNPLHKYVPQDNKHIKYTITLLQRESAYLHRTQ